MGISADFDPAPGSESHQSGSRFTPVPCEPEIPMHIRTSLISESEYIEPWDLIKIRRFRLGSLQCDCLFLRDPSFRTQVQRDLTQYNFYIWIGDSGVFDSNSLG